MKSIRQCRVAGNPEEGTFSTWVLDGQPICVVLEPYSRDNASGRSCINSGQYLMERYDSPRYGNVWMVRDVEGRDYVEAHWGNTDDNTKACFILGEQFGILGNKWAVLQSKKAFKEFMHLTRNENKLMLTIVDCY